MPAVLVLMFCSVGVLMPLWATEQTQPEAHTQTVVLEDIAQQLVPALFMQERQSEGQRVQRDIEESERRKASQVFISKCHKHSRRNNLVLLKPPKTN